MWHSCKVFASTYGFTTDSVRLPLFPSLCTVLLWSLKDVDKFCGNDQIRKFSRFPNSQFSVSFPRIVTFSRCVFNCCSVVTQHSSAVLNTPGKVAQVVVAMDPARRAVQSAYVVDGSSLSTTVQSAAEPTSTTGQTMMSPRPSILRKRPHDV